LGKKKLQATPLLLLLLLLLLALVLVLLDANPNILNLLFDGEDDRLLDGAVDATEGDDDDESSGMGTRNLYGTKSSPLMINNRGAVDSIVNDLDGCYSRMKRYITTQLIFSTMHS
jgi:hypothetical protein